MLCTVEFLEIFYDKYKTEINLTKTVLLVLVSFRFVSILFVS